MAASWKFKSYDRAKSHIFFEVFYENFLKFETINPDDSNIIKSTGFYDSKFSHSINLFSAGFKIKSLEEKNYTVFFCKIGQVKFEAAGSSFELPAVGAFPISPQSGFTLASLSRLNLAITRFDSEHVRRVCAAWLGTPPDALPLFSVEPFSPALKAEWQHLTDLFSSLHMGNPIDEQTSHSLEEYAIGLLLRGHPHSLTRFLEDKAVASRALVEEALAWIAQNQQPHLTPVHVAEALVCPLTRLERGFRTHMDMSMREAIYIARINAIETQAGNSAISPQRRRDKAAETGALDSRMAQRLERVRLHIMAFLSRPVSTSELAAVAGLPVNQLRDAFREFHDMTPSQYVMRERLDWASSLLAGTDKSMATIAAETGFSTQAHLNVAFKKNMGLTPGEWRRSNGASGANASPES